MSLTSGLSDWLAGQGIWCPEGDGDTLRTAAAAWDAMGTAITDIGVTLDAAATTLGATTTGSGTSTFGAYWKSWSGDSGYLAVSATYCSQLAAALTGFATDVDVASGAVLEGIEWAITQSNLAGPTTFTAGAIPEAVPAGITPTALAELKTAIEQYAATLGAAAQSQAASAGVTAVDPSAPPASPAAPVTTSTTRVDIISSPLAAAPDLGSLATAALDFGAGQGTVLDPSGAPVALAAPPAPATTPLSAGPSAPGIDWSTYDPTSAAASVLPAGSTVLTAPVAAAGVAGPTAMLTAALGLGKAVRAAAGSASSLASSARGGGGAGGGAVPSFATPPLATIPTSKIKGTPVTVPPPSAATLAAEKAAEDTAKAAATGKAASGSMPFMPMGMGGAGAGGAGDDRDEARRRKRR